MSLLSEVHTCLHHCPSPLYPFDLIHQNILLCRSHFCHTPAFPIAPFPFLCLLFLSPALSLVSSLPLCHSLFSLLLPPLFYVCYFCRNYSLLNVSSLSANSCLPFKPSPLLCSFDFFHQTLMKPLGKLLYQVLLTYPTWQSTDKNSGLPVIFDVLFIICDCMLI